MNLLTCCESMQTSWRQQLGACVSIAGDKHSGQSLDVQVLILRHQLIAQTKSLTTWISISRNILTKCPKSSFCAIITSIVFRHLHTTVPGVPLSSAFHPCTYLVNIWFNFGHLGNCWSLFGFSQSAVLFHPRTGLQTENNIRMRPRKLSFVMYV